MTSSCRFKALSANIKESVETLHGLDSAVQLQGIPTATDRDKWTDVQKTLGSIKGARTALLGLTTSRPLTGPLPGRPPFTEQMGAEALKGFCECPLCLRISQRPSPNTLKWLDHLAQQEDYLIEQDEELRLIHSRVKDWLSTASQASDGDEGLGQLVRGDEEEEVTADQLVDHRKGCLFSDVSRSGPLSQALRSLQQGEWSMDNAAELCDRADKARVTFRDRYNARAGHLSERESEKYALSFDALCACGTNTQTTDVAKFEAMCGIGNVLQPMSREDIKIIRSRLEIDTALSR